MRSFIFQIEKMFALTKPTTDSIKVERMHPEKKFDDCCFIELSDIFNKNAKWKSIANSLGYQDYIASWQKLRNPTKVLLMYAEVIALKYILLLHTRF